MTQLSYKSANELAKMVLNKEISSSEPLEYFIKRVESSKFSELEKLFVEQLNKNKGSTHLIYKSNKSNYDKRAKFILDFNFDIDQKRTVQRLKQECKTNVKKMVIKFN